MTRLPLVFVALMLLSLAAGGASAATHTWDGNVNPFIIPAIPPHGVFGIASNWDPDQVPGAGDTALFNRPAVVYVVTFNGDATSNVLRVEAGSVLFQSSSTATRNYSLTGSLPVMIVKSSALTIGTTSKPVAIGGGRLVVGTTGEGTVVVNGSGSRLDGSGITAHTIGGGGFDGVLRYQSGAGGTITGTLNVGVWNASNTNGDLEVFSNADVTVGNLQIGTNSVSASGEVTVDGTGSTLVQSGAATLDMGGPNIHYVGRINVNNGGVFSTGTGEITVNTGGDILVGFNGVGTLNANGHVVFDGGGLNVGFSGPGSSFNLAPGKSVLAHSGAELEFLSGTTDFGDGTY